MNRRHFCMLLGAVLFHPDWARADQALIDLYPSSRLNQERPRFQQRVGELYRIIASLIVRGEESAAERRILQDVRLEFPMADENGSPLNFFSYQYAVVMPVLSLLFVED